MAKKKENTQFESVVEQLGAILETIDSEDGSLEQSLRAYEEGVGLVRQAQQFLDAAEQRINMLGKDAPDGDVDSQQ